MKTNYPTFLKIIVPLFFCVLTLCCQNNKYKPAKRLSEKKLQSDGINDKVPEFLYALNLPEIIIPFVAAFSDKLKKDTLDLENEVSEAGVNCKIFIRGEKKKALVFKDIIGVWLYDEGDLNGDGTNEIGILPGYQGSACKSYQVFTYKNHRWKLLYNISSHLGDREKGIDYVKRMGDTIRILKANDDCCQCFGMDTVYIKLKNKLKGS